MHKCVGLMGRLLGHKFASIDRFHSHCQRCGMPKGGWNV
jgi:hypothetical protein